MDFQPYLNSILSAERSSDWCDRYTPTRAELPLKVQIHRGETEPSDPFTLLKETPQQFEVLTGLRAYAAEQVLLIGKPGSGKSTALKRLAWELATARVQDANAPIPVLVELRELGRSGKKSVLDLIEAIFKRNKLRLGKETIEDLLRAGQVWVLLDGLNEVSSADAIAEVDSFRTDYADAPMVFTSREARLVIQHKLEMLPLTVPQMEQFVEARLPGQAEKLLQALRDRLRDLAETPLLLAMLCEVYRPDAPIPKNRGELFRRKLVQDYEQEHKPEGTVPVSPDFHRFKDELLQYLAVQMMQAGSKPTDFVLQCDRQTAERWLETWLRQRGETDAATKAKKWLQDLLEHHLLQVAANPEQIEFHHQLFQEYYAAEWLLNELHQHAEWLEPLPNQEYALFQQEYLNYLKWTEPLAMLLGLLEDEALALRVVRSALAVDWMLGARLAGEVKPILQSQTVAWIDGLNIPLWLKVKLLRATVSSAAVNRLIKVFKEDTVASWEAAGALAEIGSNAVPALLAALNDADAGVRQRAALALSRIGCETAVEALSKALYDADSFVRRVVAKALEDVLKVSNPLHLPPQSPIWGTLNLRIPQIGGLGGSSGNNFDFSNSLLGKVTVHPLSVFWADFEAEIDRERFAHTRSTEKLATIKDDCAALTLPILFTLISLAGSATGEYVLDAILGIQAQCQFYNYGIAQAAKQAPVEPNPQSAAAIINVEGDYVAGDKASGDKIMGNKINTVGNLNTGSVTLQGDQIGEILNDDPD